MSSSPCRIVEKQVDIIDLEEETDVEDNCIYSGEETEIEDNCFALVEEADVEDDCQVIQQESTGSVLI